MSQAARAAQMRANSSRVAKTFKGEPFEGGAGAHRSRRRMQTSGGILRCGIGSGIWMSGGGERCEVRKVNWSPEMARVLVRKAARQVLRLRSRRDLRSG